MVINYRGKNINIKDKYIDEFKKYNGFGISQNTIDSFIFLEYIKDKSKESFVPDIATTLSEEEIEKTVNKYTLSNLRVYTCNPTYA